MAQLEKILPPSTRSVKSGLRARGAEKIESIKDDSKENHSVARGSKRPWPPCKVSSDTRRRICVWMMKSKILNLQKQSSLCRFFKLSGRDCRRQQLSVIVERVSAGARSG